MSPKEPYYELDPRHTDPKRLRAEREKAQKLRKSRWWLDVLAKGLCHYCNQKFDPKNLTMDHVVPLARGGASTQNNIVPSCRSCNSSKRLETPAERILRELEAERLAQQATDPQDDEG